MSDTSTTVSSELFEYVAAHTSGEDDFLRELKKAATEAGIPSIWIAPEQASFQQILLRATGARRVVEVGTLAGYSAIVMARALPDDGRVDTIELMEAHAAFAETWIAKSNVAGRVTVHRGAGTDVLRGLADGSADAMFVDADKESYGLYLVEARRILKRGGLVLVDNAFAFGKLLDAKEQEASVLAVRSFNDTMAQDEAFHSVIVPIGDGLWVGVRR